MYINRKRIPIDAILGMGGIKKSGGEGEFKYDGIL
jgi:hypothetical protein